MGPQTPPITPISPHQPASFGFRSLLVAALLFQTLLLFGAGEPQTAGQSPAAASAQEQFTEARQLLQKGDADSALAAAQAGLKLAPRSLEGLNLLGIIYGHKRDFARGVAAFEAALKIDPHSSVTHTNLGNIYFEEQKVDLAESEFEATLRERPDDREANYNLGTLLLAKKQPKLAITYFGRVKPQDPQVLFNLSQAYFAAGQKAKGLEIAKSLSELAKDNVRAHFTLGVLLASQEQYPDAIHEFEAADALEPGTFEILHDLGQTCLKSGDNVRSLEILDRALKLRPDSVETLYLMAQAYSNQERGLNALDLLVKAHKLAPQNTDVIFLMARLSMKQEFYADAVPLLEEGLKIAPRRPALLAALGECYFMTGKVDQAKTTFQTLVQVDPSASSYTFMGLWYRHQGQFDEAAQYFTRGLKADPRNAACLYNLGYIATRQGHYASGEKWLKQALAIQPNYSDALRELANLKMQQKKFEEALPLLRRCAQVDPNPAPVYYRMGETERSLHQMEAAERDLKIFQTLSKDPKPLPYPYQHLFDYVDQRASLPAQQQAQLDLTELKQEVERHSEQPQIYYLLAEAYLKAGRVEEAKQALTELDQLSQGDFRTTVGVGVLLARYHLYQDGIAYFKRALQSNPDSDDAWYDLADAYFRTHDFTDALAAAQHISTQGRNDPGYLGLLADVDAHMGQNDEAIKLYRRQVTDNPDRDEVYLSLALAYLRSGSASDARDTLKRGLERIPDSGQLLWGMGVVSAAEGNAESAEQYLKRSVDLLPQWPGSYSALGVLYFETGQIEKARETLDEFTRSGPQGALDSKRIEQVLSAANSQQTAGNAGQLAPQARQQFLQFALTLADQSP
ncbi:MAG TPA: tetratricopeptide repeat protein [Terriglobia bacterium]|nr:tetratricopeptide repeat protein [Terriglobia bacterium]